MSKDIRTKNVKKPKDLDKIKKPSSYKAESTGSFSATTSKTENKGKSKS